MLYKTVTSQTLVDHKVLQSRVTSGGEQSVVVRGATACVLLQLTQLKQHAADTTLLAWCVSLIAGELLGSKGRVKCKDAKTCHPFPKVPSGASGRKFPQETTTCVESSKVFHHRNCLNGIYGVSFNAIRTCKNDHAVRIDDGWLRRRRSVSYRVQEHHRNKEAKR